MSHRCLPPSFSTVCYSNNSWPLFRVDSGEVVWRRCCNFDYSHALFAVEAMLTKITVMLGNTRLEGSSLWTCLSPQGSFLPTVNASLILGQSFIFQTLQSSEGELCVRFNFKSRIIFDNFDLSNARDMVRMEINWKHEMKVGKQHLKPIIRQPHVGRSFMLHFTLQNAGAV